MFTNPALQIQKNMVNSVMANAISEIQSITGLNSDESMELVISEMNMVARDKRFELSEPVLSCNESEYIMHLFS